MESCFPSVRTGCAEKHVVLIGGWGESSNSSFLFVTWLKCVESSCNAGDLSLIPGSGRSPGEGLGHTLQYSCLGNPMDRGDWGTTVRGVAESQTAACGERPEGDREGTWLMIKEMRPIGQPLPQAEGPGLAVEEDAHVSEHLVSPLK